MVKIILDTCIMDELYDDSKFWQLICVAKERGLIDVFHTSHVRDQIHKIDENKHTEKLQKKEWMLNAASASGILNTVMAYGYVPELSRSGWFEDVPEKEVLGFLGDTEDTPRHRADVVIGLTAIKNQITLVTKDDWLYGRVKKFDGTAMMPEEFKNYLTNILS